MDDDNARAPRPVLARPAPTAVIRPYAPRDRAAVRDICCRTAFRNLGSDRLFEDREVHADYWTSYYTDHRPEASWVIEEDGAVIGYFLGCTDHADFLRVMARRIVPSCGARTLWRLATGRYRRPETRRYVAHMIFKGAREAPSIDYAKFPAHYHCNLLRQAYGRGYYTQLTLQFLDQLEARGIFGLHGHITEPRDGGIWRRFEEMFSEKQAQQFSEKPTTLLQAVLGDDRPMVNRGWGITTADYRRWIEWLRRTRNL